MQVQSLFMMFELGMLDTAPNKLNIELTMDKKISEVLDLFQNNFQKKPDVGQNAYGTLNILGEAMVEFEHQEKGVEEKVLLSPDTDGIVEIERVWDLTPVVSKHKECRRM
ncbi:unnamed protein product [Lepeophtheirus salmonis]|uniref:(salmon louse) hypothetical protein n=1 Tax=Lepeophtheirus salmonis TaxID=72036 RepID=A0A7R8CGR7_LEPSM|nr:unnamed protein product [Lepeophtheirus salmonis]CAB4057530.1 unnamed protein product [Lepeophtheirus salmonis]CAF2818111.1 unnamed protein product [Lepeophtheirus salmonis]CAF2818127.1 unnamed protein product [Lepeophtheirus salmonis]